MIFFFRGTDAKRNRKVIVITKEAIRTLKSWSKYGRGAGGAGGASFFGDFGDFSGLVLGGLGWLGSGLGLLRRSFGALPALLTASSKAHDEVALVGGGVR